MNALTARQLLRNARIVAFAAVLIAPLLGHAAAAMETDKAIIDSPLYKPAPAYPSRAVAAHIEGTVRLAVVIAPNGDVVKAEVVSAEPPGWFEEAALTAVKSWKYRPPGRQINFQLVIDFKF